MKTDKNPSENIKEKIKAQVVTIGEDQTAEEAACLMQQHNIGALVVVKGDSILGIVSERDIVRRIVTQGLLPQKVTVKEFMTRDVVTVDIKDGVKKIFNILREGRFRHVPIIDGGKLVGIVSSRDFLYLVEPRSV